MISWEKVITPKNKGGLGIINLRLQNQALLMKHLHKFYGRLDIPWVELIWNTHYNSGQIPHCSSKWGSFWWKDILRLANHYRGIAMPIVGDGKSFALWQDIQNNTLFKLDFPCLYSFAKRKSCSLAMFLQNLDLLDNFPTPLSTEASEEYIKFTITTIQGTMQGKDKWINNNFRSSKVYSLNFQFISPPFHSNGSGNRK